MISRLYICLFISLISVSAQAQLINRSFEEVDSLRQSQPKPIAVFIHTDWCKYCAQMKATTFKNENVTQLLNEAYYFISFDAETNQPITFNEHTFTFDPNGRRSGTHQLAKALGTIDGKLVYPTFVILNPELEIIFDYNGLMKGKIMTKVLKQLSNHK